MTQQIILGIGSNIGNRILHIKKAILLIKEQNILNNISLSKTYASKALLKKNAPEIWDKNFINLAISGFTDCSPKELLINIKNIEKKLGRINRGTWSPREIDIDILIYGDLIINLPELTIPHKYLLERDFAFLPANDLYPNWKYPIKGNLYKQNLSEIIACKKINSYNCWESSKQINI